MMALVFLLELRNCSGGDIVCGKKMIQWVYAGPHSGATALNLTGLTPSRTGNDSDDGDKAKDDAGAKRSKSRVTRCIPEFLVCMTDCQ
jgi:hypothetical protein